MKKLALLLSLTFCLSLSLTACENPLDSVTDNIKNITDDENKDSDNNTDNGATGSLSKAEYIKVVECAIDKVDNEQFKSAWRTQLQAYNLISDEAWDTYFSSIPQAVIDRFKSTCG